MYDKNRRTSSYGITVEYLIEKLSRFPQDAKVTICGEYFLYIHVEQDNSVVNIDNETLDEIYDENT
jgi:hypothetical protein